MAISGGKEAVKAFRLPPPPLVALFLLVLGVVACGPTRPAAESRPSPLAPAVATSDLPSPLDPAPPREIVLGKLFAPDGSMQAVDRTSKFPKGALMFLSVESGNLPRGTTVVATWTAPDGAATEQTLNTLGGEAYLTYTARSAGWMPGAGRVAVRIGEPPREMRREIAFEVLP